MVTCMVIIPVKSGIGFNSFAFILKVARHSALDPVETPIDFLKRGDSTFTQLTALFARFEAGTESVIITSENCLSSSLFSSCAETKREHTKKGRIKRDLRNLFMNVKLQNLRIP